MREELEMGKGREIKESISLNNNRASYKRIAPIHKVTRVLFRIRTRIR